MNFYCQNSCGAEDFSIDEWNKAERSCAAMGLSDEEEDKILFPPQCQEQCDDCINIVLETQRKTALTLI